MEEPDDGEEKDVILEDENANLDEGFEELDPTLPPIPFTPVKATPATPERGRESQAKPLLPIHDEDSIPSKFNIFVKIDNITSMQCVYDI
jgi:hypothetical protein